MTEVRRQLAAARRVVVKVGSSSLTSLTGGLDPHRLDALVDALAARRAAGSQVVLVSSGAIAAGLAPLKLTRRPRDLATQQAAAAVGQLLLAEAYAASFARHGQAIGQVLLTADDMIRRAHYRNAQRTLERLLGLGVVPVVNENDTVATDEIRVGDNDRLAALVAHLIGADALVLLSDVDGLYDGDPRKPGARLLTDVDAPADLAAVRVARAGADGLGSGGMATKITAAGMAAASGIPVLLAAAEDVSGAAGGVRGRAEGGHLVPAVRAPAVGPAVLAAARRRRAGVAAARRRRGDRGDRVAAVPAGGGDPRDEWRLRGRGRGGPGRPGGRGGGPWGGRVRRGRAARADRSPHPRPGA